MCTAAEPIACTALARVGAWGTGGALGRREGAAPTQVGCVESMAELRLAEVAPAAADGAACEWRAADGNGNGGGGCAGWELTRAATFEKLTGLGWRLKVLRLR